MVELLAIFGALLALEVVFFGFLAAWWLLFPATVDRARVRLDRTPWRCFWLGCLTTFMLLPPVVTLLMLPLELGRIVGSSLLLAVLAFAGLGAAGLAAKIGRRLTPHADSGVPPGVGLVPGGVAPELAVGIWLGGMATVMLLPLIVVLLALSLDLTWPVVCSLLFTVVAVAGLSAASVAGRRRRQLASSDGDRTSHGAAFVRGAVAIELAAGFPLIGWFIVIPILIITALGATVFALLRWAPGVEAPAVRRETRKMSVLAPVAALVWSLPVIVVSLSVIAFFAGGAVALELASSFPVVVWLIVVPVYVVTAMGLALYALLSWDRGRHGPLPAGGRE